MHILLTNDDGIYAQGIYAIFAELSKIGKVTVVAPHSQMSSVGHGITLAHPIWQKKVNRKGKPFGHGISGTPADCIKFAVSVLLKKKPDVIVSGINLGPNDGCSVFYSGTVAGAREGSMLNIPSISISLNTFTNPDYKYAAKYGSKLAYKIGKSKLPNGTFLNVNVPNLKPSQIRGVKVTKQGTVPIHGSFRKRVDPNLREYYWMSGVAPKPRSDTSIDTYALARRYVTITPIQSDLTDYSFLSELDNLKIK